MYVYLFNLNPGFIFLLVSSLWPCSLNYLFCHFVFVYSFVSNHKSLGGNEVGNKNKKNTEQTVYSSLIFYCTQISFPWQQQNFSKPWALTYTFFILSPQLVQVEHIGTVFRKLKTNGWTDKKRFWLGTVVLPLLFPFPFLLPPPSFPIF